MRNDWYFQLAENQKYLQKECSSFISHEGCGVRFQEVTWTTKWMFKYQWESNVLHLQPYHPSHTAWKCQRKVWKRTCFPNARMKVHLQGSRLYKRACEAKQPIHKVQDMLALYLSSNAEAKSSIHVVWSKTRKRESFGHIMWVSIQGVLANGNVDSEKSITIMTKNSSAEWH